jgi:long-chain-fatty-acid--CoA ligase ACSBG
MFRVTDPSKQVQIRFDPDDEVASIKPSTVPEMLTKVVSTYPNQMAMMYKNEVDEWKGITYKEYQERVVKMAKVFIKLGLARHGTVAILAFNSVEWFVSELATIHAG